MIFRRNKLAPKGSLVEPWPQDPRERTHRSWKTLYPVGDGIVVAALLLTTSWIFWIGTFVGSVLAVVALVRSAHQTTPRISRIWAATALTFGCVGILTSPWGYLTIVKPIISHQENLAARASIADVISAYSGPSRNNQGNFPTAPEHAIPWELPGYGGLFVLGPQVASRDYKHVSAEVWNVSFNNGQVIATTLYLAVHSATHECFFARDTKGVVTTIATNDSDGYTCSGQIGRTQIDWSSLSF